MVCRGSAQIDTPSNFVFCVEEMFSMFKEGVSLASWYSGNSFRRDIKKTVENSGKNRANTTN